MPALQVLRLSRVGLVIGKFQDLRQRDLGDQIGISRGKTWNQWMGFVEKILTGNHGVFTIKLIGVSGQNVPMMQFYDGKHQGIFMGIFMGIFSREIMNNGGILRIFQHL